MEILLPMRICTRENSNGSTKPALLFRIIVDWTKMLFLGDCEIASNNHMAKVYGNELKSDILQPPTTAITARLLEIYKLIKPSVCLWACSEKAFKEGKVRAYDFNLYLIDEAGAHFTSSTTTTIPLPYTP